MNSLRTSKISLIFRKNIDQVMEAGYVFNFDVEIVEYKWLVKMFCYNVRKSSDVLYMVMTTVFGEDFM